MRTFGRLAEWLNIRPNEVRCVSVSLAGAFIVMAFNVLARSLREALYLSSFDVKTLPYITAGVAILSLPAVGAFTTMMGRYSSRRVVQGLVLLMVAGLLVLLPFATSHGFATIGFYIWTAMGTLLLGSGFWVVTSEYFAVRGAKRLYGLIGAGGTL